jgi:hypothetical protein
MIEHGSTTMSDVDPGAQLSTTDLGEQEVQDAVEDALHDADNSAAERADVSPPVTVDEGVGASATGVGTRDVDRAIRDIDHETGADR